MLLNTNRQNNYISVLRGGGLDRISLPVLIEPMYDDQNAPEVKEENDK